MTKIINGVLEDFFETGTEGVIWALHGGDPNATQWSYDDLHIIDPGDELTVFNTDDSIRWHGTIDPDFDTGWKPYSWVVNPHKPAVFCGKSKKCNDGHSPRWAKQHNLGQQISGGCWVHWIQKGVTPDEWGKMFYQRKPRLRAKLVKYDGAKKR